MKRFICFVLGHKWGDGEKFMRVLGGIWKWKCYRCGKIKRVASWP